MMKCALNLTSFYLTFVLILKVDLSNSDQELEIVRFGEKETDCAIVIHALHSAAKFAFKNLSDF